MFPTFPTLKEDTMITTQMIKDIIDTHNEQKDLAPSDIADLLSIPYGTVTKVLQGYEALVHLDAADVEFLKRSKTNRPIYDAIIDIYGLESPFTKKPAPKKTDPKPEPEPLLISQRDILEEIRKKMNYHRTRYWILQELINDLEHDEKVKREASR